MQAVLKNRHTAKSPKAIALALFELFLVGLLAWSAAGVFWKLATPSKHHPETLSQAPVSVGVLSDFSVLSRYDAFAGGIKVAAAAPARETSLDLTLLGLRQDLRGRDNTGSAVIKLPNGQQQVFQLGDAVLSGVTLTGVARDHVVLSRGGVKESLYLPGARRTAASGTGGATFNRAAIVEFFTSGILTPHRDRGRIQGWRVGVGAAAALPAGLREGDVITHINGEPQTSFERLEEMASDPADTFVLSVQRGRSVTNIRVRVENP